MLAILFILLYGSIIGYWVYRSSFFSLGEIKKQYIVGAWIVKLLAGIIYIYLSQHVLNAWDVKWYFHDGKVIYDNLLHGEIVNYLQLTFGINNGEITTNIAPSIDKMGYWYDTPAYIIVRINALLNLITFAISPYVNVIFFSFFSFSALFFLLKTLRLYFKKIPTWLFIATVFFPSSWFWTSGMHKESVSVFLISILFYGIVNGFNKKWKYVFVVLALITLLFLRPFIVALLFPVCIAWLIYNWHQQFRPFVYFLMSYLLLFLVSLILAHTSHLPDILELVLANKEMYAALKAGNTAIQLPTINNGYWGLLLQTPNALFNSICRPHFGDVNSWWLGLASIESLVTLVGLLFLLVRFKFFNLSQRAIVISFLAFGLTYFIIIGWVVPNLGAILRYRSVALFFITPTLFLSLKSFKFFKNFD